MSVKKIGPFECVHFAGQSNRPTVIMFHGYGADMHDLSPLASELKVPGLNWYFPNGPMDVSLGGMMSGRSWFSIDIAALERAMAMGQYRNLTQNNPSGLDRAKKMAFEFIANIGVKSSDLILGGFSMGAMLATELALSMVEKPRGLIILSGALLKQPEWTLLASQKSGLPFFQSHGENDVLLDPEQAKLLNKILVDAGWVGSFQMFEGGHEIPRSVIRDLQSFLKSL